MKEIFKKIISNRTFQMFVGCFGYLFLIYTFNTVCDIYNVTTFHRVVCILSIMYSYMILKFLINLFKRKNGDI